MDNNDAWQLINRLGADLGAKPAARLKWRQRGVPHKWRIPLLQAAEAAGEHIPLEAMSNPPAA